MWIPPDIQVIEAQPSSGATETVLLTQPPTLQDPILPPTIGSDETAARNKGTKKSLKEKAGQDDPPPGAKDKRKEIMTHSENKPANAPLIIKEVALKSKKTY